MDDILKRGAGCHSNHMMRQAGLFKGIQLLLAFPSASHTGPVKDKEIDVNARKRRPPSLHPSKLMPGITAGLQKGVKFSS